MLADWRNYSNSLLNDDIQTVALYSTVSKNGEQINSSLKSGDQPALYVTVDDKLVWPEPNIDYYAVDSNFKAYDLKSLTIGQKIEASCLNIPTASGHSYQFFYYDDNNEKKYLNQDSDFHTIIPPDAYNKTLYCEYSISDTSKDNAVVTICTVDDLIDFTIQQANLKIGNEDISYTPPTFDDTTYQVKEQGKYTFNFKNWNIQYGSNSYNNDSISFWYPLSEVCDLTVEYGNTTLATGTTESDSLVYELNNSTYNLWADDQFTVYVTIVPRDIKWAKEAEITCKDTYGTIGYVDFKGYPTLSILGRTDDDYHFPKVSDKAKTVTANYYSDSEKSTLLGSNTLSMTNNITRWQSGNTTYFSGNTESNLWDLTYSPINSYTLSGTSLDITNKIPDNYKVTITFLESNNIKISKSGLDNPRDILYWSTNINVEASDGDIITVGINNTAFTGCLDSTTTLDTFNFMLFINEDSTTKKYTLTIPELSEKHDTININYYIDSNKLATHSHSGNYGFAGWRQINDTTVYKANTEQIFNQSITLYPYYDSVNSTISDTTPTYSKTGSWKFYNDTLVKTINTDISVSEWYDEDDSYSAGVSADISYAMAKGFRTGTGEHVVTRDLYGIYDTNKETTLPDAWCITGKYIQTGWDENKTATTAIYACGATVTMNSLSGLNKTLYAIGARDLVTFKFDVIDPYKAIYNETPHTLATFTERKENGAFTIPDLPETKTKTLTLNYNNIGNYVNEEIKLTYGTSDTVWKVSDSTYGSLTPKASYDYPIGARRGVSDCDIDASWYVTCKNINSCKLSNYVKTTSNYKQIGWDTNSSATEGALKYPISDSSKTIYYTDNISTLYAIWQKIKITSVSIPTAETGLVYDGEPWEGPEDLLSSFDGSTMTASCSVSNICNAGTYTIVVSLKDTTNYQWSDGTIKNKTIKATVAKMTVSIPTAKTGLTYTGSSQTGVTYVATYYYLSSGSTSETNAGDYSATFTIRSAYSGNVAFSDNSTSVTVKWSMSKANITNRMITSHISASSSGIYGWATITGTGTSGMTYTGYFRRKTSASGSATDGPNDFTESMGTKSESSWSYNSSHYYGFRVIEVSGNSNWNMWTGSIGSGWNK